MLSALCDVLIAGLSNGLIISLVALGYTMVYGIVELINFAHGDLVMLGAFAALTVIGLCLASSGAMLLPPYVLLGLLLVVVPAFCAGLNWSVDRLVYRPLRRVEGTRKLTILVSAIGVSFVFINLGLFWGGLPMAVFGGGTAASAEKSVPDVLGAARLFGVVEPRDALVWCTTLPLMAGLTYFVRRTRLGTAMRAVAQNPTAARLMGIDVDRIIGVTFLIGGALAGVAAVVHALYNGAIGYQLGFRCGLDAFTAAVLGGIGNLPGAVLGGVLIGLIRALCEGLIPGGGAWANTAVFAVLIAILIVRPSGLLGARVREKV